MRTALILFIVGIVLMTAGAVVSRVGNSVSYHVVRKGACVRTFIMHDLNAEQVIVVRKDATINHANNVELVGVKYPYDVHYLVSNEFFNLSFQKVYVVDEEDRLCFIGIAGDNHYSYYFEYQFEGWKIDGVRYDPKTKEFNIQGAIEESVPDEVPPVPAGDVYKNLGLSSLLACAGAWVLYLALRFSPFSSYVETKRENGVYD